MDDDAIDREAQDEPFLVVRQPIFDRDKNVWGYEMLIQPTAEGADAGHILLSEMIGAYNATIAGGLIGQDKKLLLNVSNESQLNADSFAHGFESCVFGLSSTASISPKCHEFTDSMHARGGIVALDSGVDHPAVFPLLEKADIIKVSLENKTPPEIVRIRAEYKKYGGELLATGVSNWEAFEGTRALGFKYFQGPFFGVAQTRDGLELAASSTAKLQLLRELANPDCEMDELGAIIASDITLSYRMLKYINSASFGLRNTIKSIQQAVSLLGLNEIRHWATVVVMTDLDSTPKGEELAYMALQRGRFLSKLAGTIPDFPHSSNTMFMLGLFSLLDALLAYPMAKALENIPLDAQIKAALCGSLNEFRDWLLMLEAVELGNWTIANEILGRYGACFTQAATQYMRASTWAASQIPHMKK
jgi:EAL and modified HD-GYP domain-containing signal transduction protein